MFGILREQKDLLKYIPSLIKETKRQMENYD